MTDPDPVPESSRHDIPPGDQPPPADGGFLPTAVGVIRSPTATFRVIAHHQPVGQALAVVLGVSVLLDRAPEAALAALE
jgi:hypothetical protein